MCASYHFLPLLHRLSRRVYPGENFLYLQDLVNWEPGQEIVLVTSALRDSRDWHENEVHVVDSVETANTPSPAVKSVVYLTSPVQYAHIGKFVRSMKIRVALRLQRTQLSRCWIVHSKTWVSSRSGLAHENDQGSGRQWRFPSNRHLTRIVSACWRFGE
jgi:hypothetical protein